MKKEVILTLFALASITLAGCAQADKSAFESSVAETAPTVTTVAAAETVPETTTVTASSETTAATVTTTTTASEVTTTAKETKKQPSSEATTTKKKTVTTSKKVTTVTTTKAKAIVTQKMSGTMYTNQAANMRKGNSTNYDKVTTLPMNTAVTITGKCDNGWYAVNAAGYSGYMSGSVLSSEKTVQKPVTTTTTKAKPKVTTTTTAKKKPVTTTTTKKASKADDKYKLTGVLACYDRWVQNKQTSREDMEAIENDILQHLVNKFNGKSGEVRFDFDGYATNEKGETIRVDHKTRNIPERMRFSIDRSCTGIMNAHYDCYLMNPGGWLGWVPMTDPKDRYEAAVAVRNECYEKFEYGIYRMSYDASNKRTNNYFVINIWTDFSDPQYATIWFCDNPGWDMDEVDWIPLPD